MTYSHKDFTGQSLKDCDDLNGLTITGSCFAQEKIDSDIFPDVMTGATFVNCNLDNCLIPSGNTIEGGSHRRYKSFDGVDWLVDENNTPVKVLS